MTTSGPVLHSNKSEEITQSFTPSIDEENVEEASPIVDVNILSIGSIVCAFLFFIIVASYVCYVHWRLSRIQRDRRRGRAPSRQLPTIPGITGSPYEEPRSMLEPSRCLPLTPPELDDTKVYLSVLPNENVSPKSDYEILEERDGMIDSTAYLIPKTFAAPPLSGARISTLPSQRYAVKQCKSVEQPIMEGDETHIPMKPIRICDSWPDDPPPPIPRKVQVFV